MPLFNGKNLDGWTPKIAGHPLGENAFNTFRVEDGILKVSYDGYEKFGVQFGHLYSNLAYSRYILRMEYRFEGKMVADAPGYVNLNSGVMYHSQPPQSMTLDQGFPVSMEFQFLADEGKGKRPTGNVCTPGTHLEMDGKKVVQHIVESTSPTFAPGDWVKIELEVRGNDEVIHRVNGKEVLRYQKPQLDPRLQDRLRRAAGESRRADDAQLRPPRAPGRRAGGVVPEHRAEVAGGISRLPRTGISSMGLP